MKRYMKRCLRLVCALAALALCLSGAAAGEAEDDFIRRRVMEDLTAFDFPLDDGFLTEYTADTAREEAAQALFAAARVRGGALIVSRYGAPMVMCAYGTRNRAGDPVTLNTQFRVASVTKMVTAIGLMRLYEAGLFDLDAPLTSLLPMRVVNPAFPEDEITVRQVLSHTSSIKQGSRYHPDWANLPVSNNYFERAVRPGSKYVYANLNGGLAGSLLEAVSGQSVNTAMRGLVFEPLKIDAAYNPGLLQDTTDLSDLMNEDGSILSTAKRELATLADYDDTCDPAAHTDLTVGKLYISALGLHRLATLMVNGGRIGERRLLSADTVRLMCADQSAVPGSSVRAESEYGLFVTHVSPTGHATWYGHQGRYNGLTADVFWQPETGLTFVMIVNGYNGGFSVEGLAALARRAMTLAEEWGMVTQ